MRDTNNIQSRSGHRVQKGDFFPQFSVGTLDHTAPEHTARAPHLDFLWSTSICKAPNQRTHFPQHPVWVMWNIKICNFKCMPFIALQLRNQIFSHWLSVQLFPVLISHVALKCAKAPVLKFVRYLYKSDGWWVLNLIFLNNPRGNIKILKLFEFLKHKWAFE